MVASPGIPRADRRGRFSLSHSKTNLLRLCVAALLLWVLLDNVAFSQVIRALGKIRPSLAFAAFSLALGSQWIASERLRTLAAMQGLAFSSLQLFRINLATLFYSVFMPAGNISSNVIRFYRMSEPEKNAGVVLSLFFDRITAMISLCAAGILLRSISPFQDPWPLALLMISALLVLAAIPAVVFLGFGPLSGLHKAALRRWPWLFEGAGGAVKLARSASAASWTRVGLYSLVAQILGIAVFSLLAAASGLEIPLATMGWVRSGVILVAALPITISGIGLREGAMVLLLGPLAIDSTAALAFSLLVFFITVLGMAFLGGLLEAWRILPVRRRPV